jgi:inner membrane protein
LSAQRSFSSSTRVVAAAAALLLVIDGLPAAVPATDGVAGALDPLAHLATAVIVLVALRPPVPVAVAAGVAVVAIDIDHIPSYLGWDGLTASNGRPYTHSAALVVVLLAVAFASRRVRLVALGAALGVTLHLWRDLVTGPGIPLVWPLAAGGVRLPYLVYGLPLALITVVALARSADQGVRARPAASSR